MRLLLATLLTAAGCSDPQQSQPSSSDETLTALYSVSNTDCVVSDFELTAMPLDRVVFQHQCLPGTGSCEIGSMAWTMTPDPSGSYSMEKAYAANCGGAHPFLVYDAAHLEVLGVDQVHMNVTSASAPTDAAHCTDIDAIVLKDQARTCSFDGTVKRWGPHITSVSPARFPADCSGTVSIAGEHFLQGLRVSYVPDPTCGDDTCSLVVDSATSTAINAHFVSCPPIGPVTLVVNNEDRIEDASGTQVFYGGQQAYFAAQIGP